MIQIRQGHRISVKTPTKEVGEIAHESYAPACEVLWISYDLRCHICGARVGADNGGAPAIVEIRAEGTYMVKRILPHR